MVDNQSSLVDTPYAHNVLAKRVLQGCAHSCSPSGSNNQNTSCALHLCTPLLLGVCCSNINAPAATYSHCSQHNMALHRPVHMRMYMLMLHPETPVEALSHTLPQPSPPAQTRPCCCRSHQAREAPNRCNTRPTLDVESLLMSHGTCSSLHLAVLWRTRKGPTLPVTPGAARRVTPAATHTKRFTLDPTLHTVPSPTALQMPACLPPPAARRSRPARLR